MNEEYISLVFDVSLDNEEALQGYFLMNFEPQGFEESPTGEMVIHINKNEWTPYAESSLKEFITSFAEGSITLDEIRTYKNTDWNAQWEAGIEPLQISESLVIAPSWRLEEAKALNPKHLIVIDPKMSFGTGHHETTRLCLKMLEGIDCKGKNILDLGSGTGILAMYAIMQGGSHATAIDIDEWAYNNAKENIERNGYSQDVIEIRLGDLTSATKPDDTFDILIANIHRNVLLVIENEIASHQKSGATLLLSGILEWDKDEISFAYEKAGYTLKRAMQENEWVALELTRN
jgi:ribosomal protein L11 methyltransferase